jgi:hypothetical protein
LVSGAPFSGYAIISLSFKNLNMRSNFWTESAESPLFSKEIKLASNLLYPLCAGPTPAKQEVAKMKGGLGRIVRISLTGAFAAALVCQVAGNAGAVEGQEVTVHSGKVDITHGVGAEPIDQVDVIMTFTNTEKADGHLCEKASDDPVVHGLVVALQEGYCGTGAPAAHVTVPSFKPTYKGSPLARFEGTTLEGAVVDGLLRTLPAPAGTCGMWNLTLDAIPLNLSRIYHNPLALSVRLPDGSKGCVNVTNALIDQ